MKALQRRLAVFLCVVMALTAVMAYAPAAQETAEAATAWEYWMGPMYVGGFSGDSTKFSEFYEYMVVAKGCKDIRLIDMLYGGRWREGKNGYEYDSY